MSLVENSNPLNEVYFHREYKNDIPDVAWLQQAKRFTTVALPFISLYKPLSLPLSLAMGSLRVVHCSLELTSALQNGSFSEKGYAVFQTTVATIAVAGTIFLHPVGMVITTMHDLGIEMAHFIQNFSAGDHQKAEENCLQIVNNALYLALFLNGGLGIGIASLSMQIICGIYHSKAEFQKGNYLEAAGHALMAMVRTHQTKSKVDIFLFKRDFERRLAESQNLKRPSSLIPAHYVGKLSDKWQFPSDHLPVGAQVGDAKVISWNVLNDHYMDWVIEKDSQGLTGSMITDLHNKPSSLSPQLTMRDDYILYMLLDMMNDPVRSDHLLLGLQECHPTFVQIMDQKIPSHMGLISSDPSFQKKNQEIVVYNKQYFDYLPLESSIAVAYPKSDLKKCIMDLTFLEKRTHEKYQIMNTHLPGDPNLPGRNEFARYVLTHKKPGHHVIAHGDMNFTHPQMQKAFEEEAEKLNMASPFRNLISYHTNIEPVNFIGKGIDHIWVDTPRQTEALKPNAIFNGLQDTVNLLHPYKDYWAIPRIVLRSLSRTSHMTKRIRCANRSHSLQYSQYRSKQEHRNAFYRRQRLARGYQV